MTDPTPISPAAATESAAPQTPVAPRAMSPQEATAAAASRDSTASTAHDEYLDKAVIRSLRSVGWPTPKAPTSGTSHRALALRRGVAGRGGRRGGLARRRLVATRALRAHFAPRPRGGPAWTAGIDAPVAEVPPRAEALAAAAC